jgi:tripartite-type tricarboxylate transporter receptor subunit TctC
MLQLPAVVETVAGFEKPPSWHGYFGPAGLAPSIVMHIRDEVVKAMSIPEIRAKLDASYLMVIGDTPDQFAAKIAREIAAMGRIAQAAGIKPE